MTNIIKFHDQAGRDLRAEITAVMASHKISKKELSRQSGVHHTRLIQWLNGNYDGDNERVEAELLRWLESYQTRRAAADALPAAPEWTETPTAGRVLSALRYAHIAGDMAVVYGGAGVGKTETAKYYRAENPNVFLATMSPDTAGVVPALEEIAIAVGVEVSGGAAKLRRGIVRRLTESYGLLIVDDAQALGVAALDAIRAIHDATSIGIVLMGNEKVYATMTGGNRAAYLDRLYSRIGKRMYLRAATANDVDALIAAWQLKDKSCISVCKEIAGKPGGLRVLTKTLRLASLFAAGAKHELCCTDIRAAWRDLAGEA